jgi:gluconolactonase
LFKVVTDGFEQSNDIEFSPAYLTCYITDTDAITVTQNPLGVATIYAFDVVDGKYLRNRRVFAYSSARFPDEIHTDTEGNLYAGCGDGVHGWNTDGVLLGKNLVDGSGNNFAFVPEGMLVFKGKNMYSAMIAARGRDVEGT